MSNAVSSCREKQTENCPFSDPYLTAIFTLNNLGVVLGYVCYKKVCPRENFATMFAIPLLVVVVHVASQLLFTLGNFPTKEAGLWATAHGFGFR